MQLFFIAIEGRAFGEATNNVQLNIAVEFSYFKEAVFVLEILF